MTDTADALLLSLRIAVCATALASVPALALAWRAARRPLRGQWLLETVVLLPLVLPPTVVGYLLVQVLGAGGWIGGPLRAWFDVSLLFRVEGAILAAAVVAMPLLYLPAKAAFASIDREHEEVARLLGASRLQMLRHVTLPLARRGVAAGLLLAFARALGEFGATLMVFGWQPGRATLPIAIYAAYEQGTLHRAVWPVLLLSMLCAAMLLLHQRLGRGE